MKRNVRVLVLDPLIFWRNTKPLIIFLLLIVDFKAGRLNVMN